MTPNRRRQIEALYRAARDPEKRSALLAGLDPEIRREVEALLEEERLSTMPTMEGPPELLGPFRSQNFYLVNVDTGERRQLTDFKPGYSMRNFDISPDGKRIVFDRIQENSDVVLIDLPPGKN